MTAPANGRLPNAKAVRTALFLAVLIALASGLDALFGVAGRLDKTSKVNWVYGMHHRQMDYVVIGSSRAYVATDIPILDSTLGGHGLNLGQNGAAFAEIALLFDIFLQENGTRRVLLEVDSFGLDSAFFSYPFHQYLFLPHRSDPIVATGLRDYFGARALFWQYVPLFGYAEFNDRIGIKSVLRVLHRAPPEFDEFGTRYYTNKAPDSAFARFRDTTYAIDSDRVTSLEHILSVARARHIDVTMYTASEYLPAQQMVRNRDAIFAYYDSVGARYGATFLTIDDQDIARERAYFHDPRHLNSEGARMFSRRLGEALKRAWMTENKN